VCLGITWATLEREMSENKGARVKSLKQLYKLAVMKKAVVCDYFIKPDKHIPAAFVVSMQGITIHRMIERGLFIYKRRK
jgi:hypothetical protein